MAIQNIKHLRTAEGRIIGCDLVIRDKKFRIKIFYKRGYVGPVRREIEQY